MEKIKAYITIFFVIICIDLTCIHCYIAEVKDIGYLLLGLFVTIALLFLLYLEIIGINKEHKHKIKSNNHSNTT